MAVLTRTLFGAALLAASGLCSAVTTYDATAQFDSNNNPSALGGWSYGSSSGLGGAFTLMQTIYVSNPSFKGWSFSQTSDYPDVIKNTSGSVYTDPQGAFIPKDALTLAPGQGLTAGKNAVVRWTAPASGPYAIDSVFTGVWDHANSFGDVHVLVNGSSIFSGSIDRQTSTSFSGTRMLLVGDVVDFSLGQSVPNEWARSILGATISVVPEPAAFLLFLTGICGLYAFKKPSKAARAHQ